VTILTNSFTTFAAKGIREELADVIYNISPEETPFISNAGRDDMSNTFTEWQQDSLAAASGSNAQLEGDDLAGSYDAVTATVRIGNYAQISRKSVSVSGTEELVNKAGRKSEIAYQIAKKSAELKRDIETTAIGTNQIALAGNTTTARTTATMLAWIKTNVANVVAGGANPSYTTLPNSLRTDGTTPVAFTETMLKSAAQLVWTAGGNPKTLMVDGPQKQTVSGFSGIATKTYYQTQEVTAAIIGAADVYVTDFGTLAIVPNRFQRHRDAWLIDWEYVKIAYLRAFQQMPLAKTGDAENRLIIAEWALKVTAENAHGLVADLS